MLNRRQFLEYSSAASLGLLLSAGAQSVFAKQQLSRIGLALYTVRHAMAESVPDTLKRVAEIGYDEVEFAGYFDHSAKEISTMLDDAGLVSPSGHYSLSAFKDDFEASLEIAHTIGQKYLVLAWIPPGDRTMEFYKQLPDILNKTGEMAHSAGMQIAYHNHDFEFETVDGFQLWEFLTRETGNDLLQFQLDLYWLKVANQDPLSIFDRFPGRTPLLHIKDMAADKRRSMANVGDGIIDFARVLAAADKAGIKHYLVERDNAPCQLESAAASFETLSALEF